MTKRNMLEIYMSQIRGYSLLSREQEILLARKVREGDMSARQQLINGNLRLVASIAEKYSKNLEVVMDLIQEGNVGLVMAVDKYSPSFSVRFSTYAYPWITQYILRYIQSKLPAICLPARKEEELRRVRNSRAHLCMVFGREPSMAELATYLDLPEASLRRILSYSYACSSIHAELCEGEGLTGEELLADERFSVERVGFRNLVAEDVRRVVSGLPHDERQVIFYRFNLDKGGRRPRSFREVGDRIGCSAETVRKLEGRALGTLRRRVDRELMSV